MVVVSGEWAIHLPLTTHQFAETAYGNGTEPHLARVSYEPGLYGFLPRPARADSAGGLPSQGVVAQLRPVLASGLDGASAGGVPTDVWCLVRSRRDQCLAWPAPCLGARALRVSFQAIFRFAD